MNLKVDFRTDECTIQLQTHRRFAPQIGEAPKPNSWSVSVIHTLVLKKCNVIIFCNFIHMQLSMKDFCLFDCLFFKNPITFVLYLGNLESQ